MKLFNVTAWGHVAVCLFFAFLFIMAAGFTLTTTQLLFEYGFVGMDQLHYGWDTLMQLSNAVHGEYSGRHLVAVVLSWMLLACYTIANSVKKWVKNNIAHDGLQLFCHAMIILDGIANWSFLAGVPWYWQILFTIAIYTALAHFGKIVISQATLAIMEFFEV